MDLENNDPFLTVIVSAYQMERYLSQCLASLSAQTLPAFYAIIVDDSSTDGTTAIADRFCNQYPRKFSCIRVSHRGLGAVRNFGLSLVKTPFVLFLDADDWIPADFIACLSEKLQTYPDAEIIYTLPQLHNQKTAAYEHWYDHDVIVNQLRMLPQPFDVQSTPELFVMEPSASSKVFRVSFLRRIHFAYPEGVLWEDVLPYYTAVLQARTCIVMEQSGFIYRINGGQQITHTRSRRVLEMIPQLERVYDMLVVREWSNQHWACYLKRVLMFSKMMVSLSTLGVIFTLGLQIHRFYRKIPKTTWLNFLRSAFGSSRKDTIFLTTMRSVLWPLSGTAFYIYKRLMKQKG